MIINYLPRHKTIMVFTALLMCLNSVLLAQETDTTSQRDDSLQDLMELKAFNKASELQQELNQNVNVSSRKALSSRETPGIISVVTAEEIQNSGARDLVDVMRLVPGFDIGTDVDFVLGLGVRGNWANEGKVLLLVDGIEYNEILFQSNQLGNRFPVDMIERIEINRGPGSAIYGGTAEYAVINIITKNQAGFQGIQANATYGHLQDTYARQNASLGLSKNFDGLHMDAAIFVGKGNRAEGSYTQMYYDPVNLSNGYAKADPFSINAGLRYKGGSVRAIYDRYQISSTLYETDFSHLSILAKYKFKLTDKLSVTPIFSYTDQLPWYFKGNLSEDEEDWFDYKVRAKRRKAGVNMSYDLNRKWNFIFGGEYFQDHAQDLLQNENFGTNTNEVTFNNISVYGQTLFRHYWANITAGFRMDHHNIYGAAFVPRVAVTKRIENFHFKLLYSKSYRAPGIENININEDIKPERSHVGEIELGYQFTPKMLLTLNVFNIYTRDVIVYLYDWDTDVESYINYDKGGSRGLEMVYQYKSKKWYADLTYSLALNHPQNTLDRFQVEGKERMYLAFPVHKFTLNSSFNLTKSLTINPSVVMASERFAYNEVNAEEEAVLNRLEPYLMGNLFVNYNDAMVKGLRIGAGVYNILDQYAPFAQPYNGDYAPAPNTGREWLLKLSYTLPTGLKPETNGL